MIPYIGAFLAWALVALYVFCVFTNKDNFRELNWKTHVLHGIVQVSVALFFWGAIL